MSTRDIEDGPWNEDGPRRDDDMFGRRENRKSSRGVPDFVRRAIENTMGSMQSTQSVSKEAIQFFISTTDKTRREIVRIAASEVGEFLKHTDLAGELIKVLTSLEADVHLSVKFRRTDQGGVEPVVSSVKGESPDPSAAATQKSPPATEPKEPQSRDGSYDPHSGPSNESL